MWEANALPTEPQPLPLSFNSFMHRQTNVRTSLHHFLQKDGREEGDNEHGHVSRGKLDAAVAQLLGAVADGAGQAELGATQAFVTPRQCVTASGDVRP